MRNDKFPFEKLPKDVQKLILLHTALIDVSIFPVLCQVSTSMQKQALDISAQFFIQQFAQALEIPAWVPIDEEDLLRKTTENQDTDGKSIDENLGVCYADVQKQLDEMPDDQKHLAFSVLLTNARAQSLAQCTNLKSYCNQSGLTQQWRRAKGNYHVAAYALTTRDINTLIDPEILSKLKVMLALQSQKSLELPFEIKASLSRTLHLLAISKLSTMNRLQEDEYNLSRNLTPADERGPDDEFITADHKPLESKLLAYHYCGQGIWANASAIKLSSGLGDSTPDFKASHHLHFLDLSNSNLILHGAGNRHLEFSVLRFSHVEWNAVTDTYLSGASAQHALLSQVGIAQIGITKLDYTDVTNADLTELRFHSQNISTIGTNLYHAKLNQDDGDQLVLGPRQVEGCSDMSLWQLFEQLSSTIIHEYTGTNLADAMRLILYTTLLTCTFAALTCGLWYFSASPLVATSTNPLLTNTIAVGLLLTVLTVGLGLLTETLFLVNYTLSLMLSAGIYVSKHAFSKQSQDQFVYWAVSIAIWVNIIGFIIALSNPDILVAITLNTALTIGLGPIGAFVAVQILCLALYMITPGKAADLTNTGPAPADDAPELSAAQTAKQHQVAADLCKNPHTLFEHHKIAEGRIAAIQQDCRIEATEESYQALHEDTFKALVIASRAVKV